MTVTGATLSDEHPPVAPFPPADICLAARHDRRHAPGRRRRPVDARDAGGGSLMATPGREMQGLYGHLADRFVGLGGRAPGSGQRDLYTSARQPLPHRRAATAILANRFSGRGPRPDTPLRPGPTPPAVNPIQPIHTDTRPWRRPFPLATSVT